VFGLFTAIMMFDQLSALFDGTSTIDQIKGNQKQTIGKLAALEAVFGESFCFNWFLPTEPPNLNQPEIITKLALIQ
jgi:hypothetical protein